MPSCEPRNHSRVSPVMRHSLRALALLSLALPAAALAQRPLVDEGTLLVSRNGRQVGREAFRVQVAENGRFLTATSQASFGTLRVVPALSVDSASGAPVLYRVELRSPDNGVERLQATGRPGRLSAVAQRASGEAAKEYVFAGNAVILEEDVYHHYAMLTLTGRVGSVTVVVPRRGEQRTGTIAEHGRSSLTVGGRTVDARHLTLQVGSERHELWVDTAGRLLKVAIPARGVEAVREELPR